jgi:hypothetical protein
MRAAVLTGLLMLSGGATAEPVLEVAFGSADLKESTELGEIKVEGIGPVLLTAKRTGTQVVVRASGPGQVLLGRAETTIGLSETPVYIGTPEGLKKLTVVWGGKSKSGGIPGQ